MDVGDELPFNPTKDFKQTITEMYKEHTVFKSFIDTASELLLDKFLLPSYGLPNVTKSAQVTSYTQVLDFTDGLKDGVVEITGTDSKLFKCNKNLTDFRKVYYDDWQFLLVDTANQFTATTWNITGERTSKWIGSVFKWPFDTLYNCYWATNDLIYRYDEMTVPLYLQPVEEDGTYEKVDFWYNVLINLAFNAGYQLRDALWIIFTLDENEGAPD